MINTTESQSVKQSHDIIFLIGVMALLFLAVITYLLISYIVTGSIFNPINPTRHNLIIEEFV